MKFQTLKFAQNKNKIIIGIVGLVFLIAIAIIIGRSFAFSAGLLDDQVVDGLSFENAKLEYSEGITTFLVDVYNENGDVYSLKNISIVFTDDKGNTTTLIGYIGESLEKGELKYLSAKVDEDLSNSSKLKYEINK